MFLYLGSRSAVRQAVYSVDAVGTALVRYGEDAGHGVDCADAGMLGRPVSGTTCSSAFRCRWTCDAGLAAVDDVTRTKAFRAVWVRS